MSFRDILLMGAVIAFCAFDLYELISDPDDSDSNGAGWMSGGRQTWELNHG